MENMYGKIRSSCWTKAMQAFGTSYIYSKRIKGLKRLLNWSKVTGIALPVFLGGMVGSYYHDRQVMDWVLLATAPLAVAQLVFSAILTVNGTEESLSKAISLSVKNLLLSDDFKRLADYPPDKPKELKRQYSVLCERERVLIEDDPNISEKENRMGMRAGLREFQQSCVGCKMVPVSMKPTTCEVCGNF